MNGAAEARARKAAERSGKRAATRVEEEQERSAWMKTSSGNVANTAAAVARMTVMKGERPESAGEPGMGVGVRYEANTAVAAREESAAAHAASAFVQGAAESCPVCVATRRARGIQHHHSVTSRAGGRAEARSRHTRRSMKQLATGGGAAEPPPRRLYSANMLRRDSCTTARGSSAASTRA